MMLTAVTVLGAMRAQWSGLQMDRTLQSRMRATLIADAALELIRMGWSETSALSVARRDASRQLRDGVVTTLRDSAGVSVLVVGWSELGDALGGEPGADCAALPAVRAGYVIRCVSIGYMR